MVMSVRPPAYYSWEVPDEKLTFNKGWPNVKIYAYYTSGVGIYFKLGGGRTSTVVFERPKLVHSSGGSVKAPAGGN